jgi:hypothetical protein
VPDAAVLDPAGGVEVVERRSSSPCMAKLDRLTWATCDWFEVNGYRFGVRSTSPGFGEWVRYALDAYRVDGPPQERDDPRYALIVQDRAGGSPGDPRRLHIMYEGTWGIIRTFDVRAIARSFLSEIESLTFPDRSDAVFLDGSIIQGTGTTILIPTILVPAISAAGRRIRRSVDLRLPAQMSIALDPATGALVPAARGLRGPEAPLDALADHVPLGAEEGAWAFVDQASAVDRILQLPSLPSPDPAPVSKAHVVYDLARSVSNLHAVGKTGIVALGRLVERADVMTASWADTEGLVRFLAAATNGRFVRGAGGLA